MFAAWICVKLFKGSFLSHSDESKKRTGIRIIMTVYLKLAKPIKKPQTYCDPQAVLLIAIILYRSSSYST